MKMNRHFFCCCSHFIEVKEKLNCNLWLFWSFFFFSFFPSFFFLSQCSNFQELARRNAHQNLRRFGRDTLSTGRLYCKLLNHFSAFRNWKIKCYDELYRLSGSTRCTWRYILYYIKRYGSCYNPSAKLTRREIHSRFGQRGLLWRKSITRVNSLTYSHQLKSVCFVQLIIILLKHHSITKSNSFNGLNFDHQI